MQADHPPVREQVCRRCGRVYDELDFLTPPVEPRGWEFGRGRCASCWVEAEPPAVAGKEDGPPTPGSP